MNNIFTVLQGFAELTDIEREAAIQQIKEAIDIYRPSVSELTGILLSFGPELYKLFEGMGLGLADLQTAVFKRFLDNGFTRQEAMELITANKQTLKDGFKRK